MKHKTKTFLNVLLILFVLSFFVTPLGYQGKLLLNKIFAQSPEIISEADRSRLANYNWRLKDIDFYLITNEERPPVEEFVDRHEITAPITYLIIGDKTPLDIPEPPASYIIDKNGTIVSFNERVSDWNSTKTRELLDKLVTATP